MTRPLSMLVIYDNPRDAPGWYIVREHLIYPTDRPMTIALVAHFAARFRTLKDARIYASPCRFCMPRWPADDPVIVESWL